jgi:hypothetical protein
MKWLARCTLVGSFAVVALLSPAALGYSPQSPEVQELVGRAVGFLKEKHATGKALGFYDRLGGTCLVGLAVFKHTGSPTDPLVMEGVKKCRAIIGDGNRLFQRPGIGDYSDSNYDLGLALIFLCELDPDRYRQEIEVLLRALLQRQQRGGGWSYAPASKGDTSQTQYGVLGLWITHRSQFTIPQSAVEGVCNWLLRTQTPDGGWGYDPQDPGSYDRISQNSVTLSRSVAGLGSIYICSELLGFTRGSTEPRTRRRLPAALHEVGADSTRPRGPLTNQVPGAQLQRVLRDGNNWISRNFNIEHDYYQHYYMYALERYMSFREHAEGTRNPQPRWYNEGVELLIATEKDEGGWSDSLAGAMLDTSFAVLFLLRSTQTSLNKVIEETGRLRGGKSLPSDLSQIAIDASGQVVSTKEKPPIDDLLSRLEKSAAAEIDSSIPRWLALAEDRKERTAQVTRLRRMAISGSFQARLTAVETLGRDRDMDNVPALIYAISDPDPRVMRAARNGLRFISRRIDGFGLPSAATPAEQRKARSRWREWYLAIRPNGELIE